MINALWRYQEAGEKAGNAMRKGDVSRSSHEYEWLVRALSIETLADRAEAREAYDRAYRKATNGE